MLRMCRRDRLTGLEISKIKSLDLFAEDAQAEWVYYIALAELLTADEMQRLLWLLAETYDPKGLSHNSLTYLHPTVIEVGPSLNFETPWGSTARGIMHNMGLGKVVRIERSRRISFGPGVRPEQAEALFEALHDRMTEMSYNPPPASFESGVQPKPIRYIPLIEEGIEALRIANQQFGLAMDEDGINYVYDLFVTRLGRNPTDVELFQYAQGNSEHSRHGFFRGPLIVDGQELGFSLMDAIKAPYKANPNNSIIAFHDDSSSIRGSTGLVLVASQPGQPGELILDRRTYHPTLTAETHNFPTGVAPYPGAATGTGGRIRDNQCVGRGGLVIASGVGYCVGNLHIPGYDLPWENDDHRHPNSLASPLVILIEASNGASDYGNCFGEPVINGHVRTFGMDTPNGRREWYKPVMYTAGVGLIDDRHTAAQETVVGMQVVQIGSPAYRIGMGGSSASSMMSGENAADLDFDAVQRGAPEAEQRMNRVLRACVELGDENPIVSAHDIGGGGVTNAFPEIVAPFGGHFQLRNIPIADSSLSVLEIWGNESQERNCFLIRPDDLERFQELCAREGVPCATVGEVTEDGQLIVFDDDGSTPVNLPITEVVGDVPPNPVVLTSTEQLLAPLVLPEDLTVYEALRWVLRLVSVGSKSWLTRKVDRSVTGLIAQQQCVGPFHTPLCGFAVEAHSHFGSVGTAFSQGEKPLVGLISPEAQGRMAVAEALTNLVGAVIEDRRNIKYTSRVENARCSANWMWAAKLPGEGARLVKAALAMRDIMLELGMAVDGGKDSLSMASMEGSETVKGPGQLVITPYALMPDVTLKVTPEFKVQGNQLLFIDLGLGETRLGGSALAQVYQQLGDECPDVEDTDMLARAFEVIQDLISEGLIESLHDRSDGGLIVTLVEMAIAGGYGANIDLVGLEDNTIAHLFNEELGLVLEVSPKNQETVQRRLHDARLYGERIGEVGSWDGVVSISYGGELVIYRPVQELRADWEDTSMHLDELQTNPGCVAEEFSIIKDAQPRPNWQLSFEPRATSPFTLVHPDKPRVALVREVGTNGDRELAASLIAAGFSVEDITMTDLRTERATLEPYRGVVFPGGFSNGDVLDSAKGWAGVIQFDPQLTEQFQAFYDRPDTFSFGPCNGAQLMTLLSWAPFAGLPDAQRPRLIRNTSERFESRFPTVQILPSPAIMLQGMEGSRLGVWVAHGEGRLHVPDPKLLDAIIQQGLAPLRYVNTAGEPTTQYPFNPNGSPEGITALCSPDGRHLAMMPHPERLANALWQWPWMPESWKRLTASPWLRMFQNAYVWCINN